MGTTHLLPKKNYGALLLEEKNKLVSLRGGQFLKAAAHEGKKLKFPFKLGM